MTETHRNGIGCKAFDAVIFDMDGVIFDSEQKVLECWAEIAEKHGVPGIDEPLHLCLGVTRDSSRKIMKDHYGADFPYDDYALEASILFHSKYDGGKLPMKPGVVELLKHLKHEGIRVALASSTRKQTVEQELRDAGIISFFDQLICGDMVTRSKPAPDIFLTACKAVGVEPERAVAIEDSYNGIRSAAAGGLRAIMVPDLMPPTQEMQELAETILPDLHAAEKYLLPDQ